MGHEMNGLPYAVAVWTSCPGRHEQLPACFEGHADGLCPHITARSCATSAAVGGVKAARQLPHCLHAPQRRVFAFETWRDVRRLARVWRHLTVRVVCELQARTHYMLYFRLQY